LIFGDVFNRTTTTFCIEIVIFKIQNFKFLALSRLAYRIQFRDKLVLLDSKTIK